MKKIRLFWQLYPSYLAIAVISLAGMFFYASYRITDFYYFRSEKNLEANAQITSNAFFRNGIIKDRADIDSICKSLHNDLEIRFTVISATGDVLGDSIENPAKMENHSDRPEVSAALNGKTGYSVRHSSTLDENIIYAAVPLRDRNKVIAVIRASRSVQSVEDALNKIYIKILFGGIAFAALAALFSLFIARRISRPLREMEYIANRFAKGDLHHRVPVPKSREFANLAEAMNAMAMQLDTEIHSYERQKNEIDSMLSSMVEGLIAVDENEKIIKINSAASGFLGIEADVAVGKHIQGVIRNTRLQEFVTDTFKSWEVIEREIVLNDERESNSFQAHGTPLKDKNGNIFGALIVLNDVTRLHKLENIRRDFVANVSHEFKTPLTSIKGSAETLLEGAWKEKASRDNFLDIIIKSSDRLYAIVEDLLSLSRIERQAEREDIITKRQNIRDVLESVISLYSPKAGAKKIKLQLSCPKKIEAEINFELLEQAVANLVDNAIKFSDAGCDVEISSFKAESEVIIAVKDHGRGIGAEHLPRIFERFFRADKGRGDKEGGTGLGLAIVKHIAEAHKGKVSVESEPGNGSIFRIHIPTI
jgi:two-component system phosphate regulon sensor histidine kinase PhoR